MIKCSKKKVKTNGGLFCLRRLQRITEDNCTNCTLADGGEHIERKRYRRRYDKLIKRRVKQEVK